MPQFSIPAVGAWAPWSAGEVAKRLIHFSEPWCIAGGRALDLWLGRQTRDHNDIEIAILRPTWPVLASRLSANRHFGAADGHLALLPLNTELALEVSQVWIADEWQSLWRMEVLLEPGDVDTWVYRRNPAVRRARRQMIAISRDGIPYLKPEGVLLYKAKAPRAKDEIDFATCLPAMPHDSRQWLRNALLCAHPGHGWTSRLEE